MRVFDTQIISYAMKGKWPEGCRDGHISSITALELLLIQGDTATKANYYVPIFGPIGFHDPVLPRKVHPFGKSSTDQLLLDFANEFPTLIEFSNLAVSQVINFRCRNLFMSSTQHLSKNERKSIHARFDYLLSEGITSIPLSRNSISLGLDLFSRFVKLFRPKKNVRNSINDTLILATALDARAELVTKDSTLARFAGLQFGVPLQFQNDHITIDFSRSFKAAKKHSSESKGYVNRGWQFHVRKYGNSRDVS